MSEQICETSYIALNFNAHSSTCIALLSTRNAEETTISSLKIMCRERVD